MVRAREFIVVIALVHVVGQHQLLGVVHTEDALSFGFSLGQRGQEHACQNGDDGDDHQELDEGETGPQRFSPQHVAMGKVIFHTHSHGVAYQMS